MKRLFAGLLMLGLSSGSTVAAQNQVLVQIDDEVVTAGDLNMAVASSPFAVQTNTMGRNEQASIRGLLLKKLVGARLLDVEAQARKLDQTSQFKSELENFERGLLYNRYLDALREKAKLSPDEKKKLFAEFTGDADAFKAAKSALVSQKYRTLRFAQIEELQAKYQVNLHFEHLKAGLTAPTILISGDGFKIPYGEIINVGDYEGMPDTEWLKNRVYEHAELVMMARAAKEQKIDVSGAVGRYRKDRLPSLMMRHLEKKWIPNEKVIRAYYKSNPALAKIPARWHIGQIVVADEVQAKSLRRKILLGKSLFVLAGEVSIDPYGRGRNGDMGWIMEGKGNPQIEKALVGLADGKVSPVIKTTKGYHLVTILERKNGSIRSFGDMKDRVRQEYINEKLSNFLNEAQKRHKVVWKILTRKTAKPTKP
ncbi:MAG: peptidylprolyl isomerase [Hyphomicrobiaceae bacterium]|nr:peptidylprolyl isomerase [Hyphomicrobiaceae bacterium]